MTPDKINRIIHEAMGKCWHEEDVTKRTGDSVFFLMRGWCGKCGLLIWEEGNHSLPSSNPDYSKWEHYGPMLEWAMGQEWWGRLVIEQMRGRMSHVIEKIGDTPWVNFYIPQEYLNPLRGSAAIAEFLEERRKNEG